jgi:hypothetical protein
MFSPLSLLPISPNHTLPSFCHGFIPSYSSSFGGSFCEELLAMNHHCFYLPDNIFTIILLHELLH